MTSPEYVMFNSANGVIRVRKDAVTAIIPQGPATTTDKFIDWSLGVERDVVGTQVLTWNAAVSTKDNAPPAGPVDEPH